MNFGKKIMVFYIGFVCLILTLVFMSYGQKVELVSADYYAQELKFQDKIDATNNAKALSFGIHYTISDKVLLLKIDSMMLTNDFSGTVTFFRPSDSSKDVQLKFNFINNKQVIETKLLEHGVYKMQLNWISNHKNYFKEEVVFID